MAEVGAGVRVPVLVAPTASGKTGLALRLGAEFPLEVVSADAFLVYRGLDVGTAKPSVSERAVVPHHVVDVVDAWEDYDVARFVRDAEVAVGGVLARGRVPLVVGGTGFYVSALMGGLPLTPPSVPEVRAGIEAELLERGLDALLAEMEALSPVEAARMQRNPRRVVRALEVFRASGRWPSEFGRSRPAFAYEVVAFAPPWGVLEGRIEVRVEEMFRAGLVEEVRGVLEGLSARGVRSTALQAIGYKEVERGLAGEVTMDEARALVVGATRAYAKRQLTWIRTQLRAEVLPGVEVAEARLRVLLGRAVSALDERR